MIVYREKKRRRQDNVNMTKISEQVRVLSILSAKLPLKYKDQFLVILVFPDSISLVQTLLDFLPVSSDFG